MVPIRKIGIIVQRQGRVLLCRKRHTTSSWILPGGKPSTGESAPDCLRRELKEELGPTIGVKQIRWLGRYEHRAAHDDPAVQRQVAIELYAGVLVGDPEARAEIAEITWFAPSEDWNELAPSLRESIFPDLIARRLLEGNWRR